MALRISHQFLTAEGLRAGHLSPDGTVHYLPTLLDERPLPLIAPGWIYEITYDGYRLTAMFGDGECKLRTRGGADATRWFPEVAKSLAAVRGSPYVIDGEICVFDDIGRSDFDRLQGRARRRRWFVGCDPVVYAVFDLMVDHGIDITQQPIVQRKGAPRRVAEP